jgi:hypothetical protein
MNLTVLNGAHSDLSDAQQWYNAQESGLGDKFTNAAQAAINDLLRDPESWPIIEDEIRRHPVDSFPFDILFAVENNDIDVVAVADQRRRPGYWKDRIQE